MIPGPSVLGEIAEPAGDELAPLISVALRVEPDVVQPTATTGQTRTKPKERKRCPSP